ncbi:hypothetical protein [Rhodopseudomonas sp. B29]|nr:hypothetical protein [Rhodopseudomonas sp. B29]
MNQPDVLVIAAAGLSTLVIWFGVVLHGKIAAAVASHR